MTNVTKPDALRVDDVVRVYAAPFAGHRARVACLSEPGGTVAKVVLLEPVGRKYLAGESARVPAAKCRKVEGLSPAPALPVPEASTQPGDQ